GNSVKLSNFKGKKVLLAFFPFAFSPVCTDEMSCFQMDMEQFKGKGVQILGISIDSHWANKAFAEKLGVSFPLLSDFNKKTTTDYGVLREDGFANRAYFLIDEKGTIRYKHVMPTPGQKLDNAELLREVRQSR
ncbi:TPA: redoxin domain-containing protein, partial [archaeon]|nr:redoxin domain-containing protein [Candidatus Naiadarchaeum limnaeum]